MPHILCFHILCPRHKLLRANNVEFIYCACQPWAGRKWEDWWQMTRSAFHIRNNDLNEAEDFRGKNIPNFWNLNFFLSFSGSVDIWSYAFLFVPPLEKDQLLRPHMADPVVVENIRDLIMENSSKNSSFLDAHRCQNRSLKFLTLKEKNFSTKILLGKWDFQSAIMMNIGMLFQKI